MKVNFENYCAPHLGFKLRTFSGLGFYHYTTQLPSWISFNCKLYGPSDGPLTGPEVSKIPAKSQYVVDLCYFFVDLKA